MPKFETITRNNDYKRLYARGKSFASPTVVCYVQKNRRPCIRIGITTSKKIGNAVKRNRARRVIKESFRHILPEIEGNWDIVFVARTRTSLVKCDVVQKDMQKILKQAGVVI